VNTKNISPIHLIATYLKINAPSVIHHFFKSYHLQEYSFWAARYLKKERKRKRKRKIYEPYFHQVQVSKKFSSSEEVQV
jgi:hypothetical protein